MDKDSVESYQFLREVNPLWRAQNLVIPIFISMMTYGLFQFSDFLSSYSFPDICKAAVICVIGLKILIETFLITRKIFSYSKVDLIEAATHVYVKLDDDRKSSYIVPLFKSKNLEISQYFVLYQIKYIYDSINNTFMKLGLPRRTVNDFINYLPLTDAEINTVFENYGPNKIEIVCPDFVTVFKSKIVSPSSIFNLFFVILCVAEGYRGSIMISIIAMVTEILISTYNEIVYNKSFKSYESKPMTVKAYRNNSWANLESCQLVPGDLVQINRGFSGQQLPCDFVVLQGSCVVDEAILTGESIPQIKESVTLLDPSVEFSTETQGNANVLYAGTTLLNVSSSEIKDLNSQYARGINFQNTCIALVIKTGFYTNKGQLFRSLQLSFNNDNYGEKETYIYILVLFLFGLGTAIYTWITRIAVSGKNRLLLFVHCVKLVVYAIPIDLSTKMLLFLQKMNVNLKNKNIFTMRVSKMPQGGKVDICFFDKTGTLTKDKICLVGVGGIDHKNITKFDDLSLEKIITLIGCTSVHQYQNHIIGDPIDTAVIEKYHCSLYGDDIRCSYPVNLTLKIQKKFPFVSSLRRMSCIVVAQNQAFERGYEYFCVAKGAPESIRAMLSHVPNEYDDLNSYYSSMGYRVLALGYKCMESLPSNFNKVNREDVESNLNFAGFLLAGSIIKSDCQESLISINKMGIKTAMISGDNPLTACHVSQTVGIIRAPVLVLDKSNIQISSLTFIGFDFKFSQIFSAENIKNLIPKYEFCITGDALRFLIENNIDESQIERLFTSTRVFARFDPHQKEFIIKWFKSKGFVVFMCGDGSNDIGALRMSDIGVAMLNIDKPVEYKKPKSIVNQKAKTKKVDEIINPLSINLSDGDVVKLGDASIAAPFTFKGPELSRCLDFLKFCNCSLAYFQHVVIVSTIYCFTYVYMQATHYSAGLIFSDRQQTFYGIISMLIYYSTFKIQPTPTVPNLKPVKSLFHPYIILTILFQSIIHIYTVYFLSTKTKVRFPIASPLDQSPTMANFQPSYFNSILLYYEFFIMLAIYIVNYCGSPFCTPLKKNKVFLLSFVLTYVGISLSLFNIVPLLTEYLHMKVLPSELQILMAFVIVTNFASAFFIDNFLFYLLVVKHKKRR